MTKEYQEQQIKISKLLAEIPGLEDSPYVLGQWKNGKIGLINRDNIVYAKMKEKYYYSIDKGRMKAQCREIILFGPWLKLEDLNPWSPRTMLNKTTEYAIDCDAHYYLWDADKGIFPGLEDRIYLDTKIIYQWGELAYNAAIAKLYEIDPEALNDVILKLPKPTWNLNH